MVTIINDTWCVYTAMGCADLAPSDNTYVERMDKGSTVVSCVNSHEKSHLVCKDRTWVGEQQNCSNGKHVLAATLHLILKRR